MKCKINFISDVWIELFVKFFYMCSLICFELFKIWHITNIEVSHCVKVCYLIVMDFIGLLVELIEEIGMVYYLAQTRDYF